MGLPLVSQPPNSVVGVHAVAAVLYAETREEDGGRMEGGFLWLRRIFVKFQVT